MSGTTEDRAVEPPDVTVVMPVYNGASTISEALTSVCAQQTAFRFEVVVVDNGSTDGTDEIVDALARRDPRIRRVVAPDRHNLSYVRNVGVRAAGGRFVLFCDDDDVVEPGWLQAMASALEHHPFVASAMEYEQLNSAGVMRGRARFQSEQLGELFGFRVANGAIGVRRDLWQSLDGNDEHLGVAGEDFDFAIRAQMLLGVEPQIVPDAIYHYRQRSGFRTTFRQAWRYGRSHVALLHRHGARHVDRRLEIGAAARDWWWIVTRVPLLVQPGRRIRWARHAGMRLGRLVGSVRERTLCL